MARGWKRLDYDNEVEPYDACRARDQAALSLVVARAIRSGLIERLRHLPPATVDRVAQALGWELGPTRAILRALAAGGLVHHDPELATWSLAGALAGNTPAAGGLGKLLDLGRALDHPTPARTPELDESPIRALAERVLPAESGLRAALESGARVIGLAGSDAALDWLRHRYPRVETQRLAKPPAAHGADLVLHLSPLALPADPDRLLADAARGLGSTGCFVLRVLRRPLEPASSAPGAESRGWWHALAVAAALQGGAGMAWSEPAARRAAHAAGCSATAYDWPQDPACVHLVLRHGSAPRSIRPR